MTARDAYRDTLRELDKFESPTFEIKDFNYFFNKAISRYLAQNYERLDVVQKDIDDMRSVIVMKAPLTMNSAGEITLPTEYRHMLHVKVKVKFIANRGRYRINDVVEFFPERMKSAQKGFRYRNAFGKPNFRRYYYELEGNTFRLLFDSASVQVNTPGDNLFIDYVKQPTAVYLNPDKTSDYNNPINNSVLFFSTGTTPTHVYYELINVCREIFLENIESVRTQEAIRQTTIQ